MTNVIYVIEHLCKRPAMFCSELDKPADLLAAIRGICQGIEDPSGSQCLGDFPNFARSRLGKNANDSWYAILERLFVGKSLCEAGDAVLELLAEWQNANPSFPPDYIVGSSSAPEKVDLRAFELMEQALRDPPSFVPGASSFREVVAFIHGICVGRNPPHGNISGGHEFDRFVAQNYDKLPVYPLSQVLLQVLGRRPAREACNEVADLLKRWRDAEGY